MDESEDERTEELGSLAAIFPELVLDSSDRFAATLELPVAPANPLLVRFLRSQSSSNEEANSLAQYDVVLSHLPPLHLRVILPQNYPADAPPQVQLSSQLNWLPEHKLRELEQEAAKLWEEYGHCQILFAYIDHLQQAAERGFDYGQSADRSLILADVNIPSLNAFNDQTKQETFDAGTYDCGVCLEPKKGSACHKMSRCGHVFCKQCLQDCYNNAIKEGDVANVRCLDPSCGKEQKKKRRVERTIHPRELLQLGLEASIVRRYVEMKRKKNLEADKATVYCPRTWCQGAAKSDKYPPIPNDLTTYVTNEPDTDDESDHPNEPAADERKVNGQTIPPDPSDRLAVCEQCALAFCKVCYMGWHGPFARCYPRDPNELSAEEKASYEYIRMHTSPCAYCNAPVQKTMGCNHMNCFQCRTHFCYLCSAWLDSQNPYEHFNKQGTPCYQRLWELEEGDEGQAPGDGRGFGGGRAFEQMAIEAARQAEAEEGEAAAREAQAEEDARGAHMPPAAPEPPAHVAQVPIIVRMAQLELDGNGRAAPPPAQRQRGGRRRGNPQHLPGNNIPGPARANRNERGGWVRGMVDAQPDPDDRRQEELQRFLEMALNDEEDDWDSDELGDHDEDFVIGARR